MSYPTWGFAITRAGLPPWNGLREAVAAPTASALPSTYYLAAVALFTGHPWGALWILLPGVVVHLYPVLLQRSIMLRLQPLLNQPSAWSFRASRAGRAVADPYRRASRVRDLLPGCCSGPWYRRRGRGAYIERRTPWDS